MLFPAVPPSLTGGPRSGCHAPGCALYAIVAEELSPSL